MAVYYKTISMTSLQRIYEPIQLFLAEGFKYLSNFTILIRIILCVVTIGVVIVLSAFRVYGNRPLMNFYDAVASIKEETLIRRLKEIK